MTILLPRIAARLFDTPLLIEADITDEMDFSPLADLIRVTDDQ